MRQGRLRRKTNVVASARWHGSGFSTARKATERRTASSAALKSPEMPRACPVKTAPAPGASGVRTSREARLRHHPGIDSHDTLGQPGQQSAELHEVVQVRGGIPVIKAVPGLPRCVKRFVQSAMYADRRRVGAAHFAPGLGQRPMFAAYVLTITDGQDMQKRNRLRPVAVTAGGAQRRGAE